MRHLTYAQLAITGAVAMTMLAIVTGAAAADGVRPDDRATHGPGAVAAAQDDIVTRPDDRATHGAGAIVAAQDDIVTRAGDPGTIPYLSHGVGVDQTLFQGEPPAKQQVQPPQEVTLGRFDWADAGVGALATLGLVLLAAGVAIVALRRRPELA